MEYFNILQALRRYLEDEDNLKIKDLMQGTKRGLKMFDLLKYKNLRHSNWGLSNEGIYAILGILMLVCSRMTLIKLISGANPWLIKP